MTGTPEAEGRIEERLKRIKGDPPRQKKPAASPWVIGAAGAALGLMGGAYIMAAAPERPVAPAPIETSSAAEFAGGAGGLDGFIVKRAAAPAPAAPEPSAEVERLQALVVALKRKIGELERNPKPLAVADDAALQSLRDRLAEIQGQLSERDAALSDAQGRGAELERQVMELQGQLDTERLMADQRRAADEDRADREAELKRRREEAAAERQAQITSGMVAWRAGGGAGAAETAGEAQERFIGADAFIRASAKPVKTTEAQLIANPSHTIVQGTLIEAALQVAINSDLPGTVSAVVTNDVWSFDMTRVLIPRGSKLFGRYESDVGLGQKRILIAWTRIVTTDGQSADIASYASDGLGRSGLPARVRSHFLQKFGAATLLSIIGAAPDYASSKSGNGEVSIIKEMGGNMQDATDQAIGDYLDIPPTLSTDQGAVVMVRVDSDLEFY